MWTLLIFSFINFIFLPEALLGMERNECTQEMPTYLDILPGPLQWKIYNYVSQPQVDIGPVFDIDTCDIRNGKNGPELAYCDKNIGSLNRDKVTIYSFWDKRAQKYGSGYNEDIYLLKWHPRRNILAIAKSKNNNNSQGNFISLFDIDKKTTINIVGKCDTITAMHWQPKKKAKIIIGDRKNAYIYDQTKLQPMFTANNKESIIGTEWDQKGENFLIATTNRVIVGDSKQIKQEYVFDAALYLFACWNPELSITIILPEKIIEWEFKDRKKQDKITLKDNPFNILDIEWKKEDKKNNKQNDCVARCRKGTVQFYKNGIGKSPTAAYCIDNSLLPVKKVMWFSPNYALVMNPSVVTNAPRFILVHKNPLSSCMRYKFDPLRLYLKLLMAQKNNENKKMQPVFLSDEEYMYYHSDENQEKVKLGFFKELKVLKKKNSLF